MWISVLLVVAVTIVVLLASYAIYVWWLVFRQQKLQQQLTFENDQRKMISAATAKENIRILIEVLQQQQLSLTEAAIRIMAYSQALSEQEQQHAFFKPFQALALATAHIPILDSWQALSAEQQRHFDSERIQFEQCYESQIHQVIAVYLQTNIADNIA